jgi:hypothetical protein
MLRLVGGAIAGVFAWFVIVTVLNLPLRYGWHDYAAVEKAMTFTLPMMVARLSISGISSVASGAIAARVDKGKWAPLIAGASLLLMFVPVHYSIWDKFPAWYHLTFLASLPLISWLGGALVHRRSVAA